MTIKEYAESIGKSERYVTRLCNEGKIAGAYKNGKSWIIPEKAEGKKSLPIGLSDFKAVLEKHYYIDKSLLIKDVIKNDNLVTLFTRPRRFGKSLNMDMLRRFFEEDDGENRHLFDNLAISSYPKAMAMQGQSPVIFLSFKEAKFNSWEATYEKIRGIIKMEVRRLSERYGLLDDPYFLSIELGKASFVDIASFLEYTSNYLHKKTRKKAIIIVDEYDTPVSSSYVNGFYDQTIELLGNLFSGGFKDNPHLQYGFLTGILPVVKESVLSDMNNLYVDSVLDGKYARYFGYTVEEVKKAFKDLGVNADFKAIMDYYDGYRYGEEEIVNPWSINNYVFSLKLKPYWERTGSNDIIKESLNIADSAISESLHTLYVGGSVKLHIDEGIVYPSIQNDPSSIFSFLLYAGYLTPIGKIEDGYELALPNREIKSIFREEIIESSKSFLSGKTVFSLRSALLGKDDEKLKETISSFLLSSISHYDGGSEAFYHGLTLGMLVLLDNEYQLTSNRESGEGRFDICLTPRTKGLSAILIEIKKANENEDLQAKSMEALSQIKDRRYAKSPIAFGNKDILLLGLAYKGKDVEISKEEIHID